MPTVIDSLVVELGLDPRRFNEGERDALAGLKRTKDTTEAFGKSVEATTNKISSIFSTLKGGAVGIIAALGGGEMAQFVDKIAHMDNAAGRLAKTIGISVGELSKWQGMVRMIGGDAGSVSSAFSGIQQAITNMLQGGGLLDGGTMHVLNQIGGVRGKTPDQIMRELSSHFANEIGAGRETPTGAATMLRRLPGMNEDMLDLILKGPDALKKLEADAIKAGIATEQSVKESADYIAKVNALSQAWQNLGRKVIPVLTGIVEVLGAIGDLFGKAGFNDDRMDRVRKLRQERAEGKATPWSQFQDIFSSTPSSGGGGSIPIKPGSGSSSPETKRIMDAISGIAGIKQVTSLNDAYHALLGGGHAGGRALDLTVEDPKNAEAVANAIRQKLEDAGISANVINEYDPAKRSKHWTSPHIHVGATPRKMSSTGPIGASARTSVSNRGGDTTTSTTHVEKVIVNTQATDAFGMARDVMPAIQNYAKAMSANSAQV